MFPMQWVSKHCQYAEAIASFIHHNQQRVLSERKLYRILELYEKWRIFVGCFRSERFEQYVLHYIAERAFWSDVKDSEYVAKLLVYMYEADGHFGFFLCPEVNSQSRVSFNDCRRHFAQFFLNHAYRNHLTIKGRRIADMEVFCRSLWLHPCEMAVITESPEFLHLLLRYGALVADGPISIRLFLGYPASSNILILTLCVIKTIIEVSGFQDQRYKDMVECGKIIMRVSPQFDRHIIRQLRMEFPGFRSIEEAMTWVAENAIPEVRLRIFLPMTLRHACRLKIRKLLHDNWQLPGGIKELSIPNILKNYLNLHFD